jgi:ubiquinone/menaquinone biosynthesis C-methylase UbiE
MGTDLQSIEIERIRAEYSRRRREIPHDFYAWNRPVNLYIQCQLTKDIVASLAAEGLFPLSGRSVADIGCGTGMWLLEFAQWGADSHSLAGIDLDEDRIAQARRKLPAADLRIGSAGQLPWPDASFDLVSQFTLFSSILDDQLKAEVAAEMLRVTKPRGAILWYDLRLNNPGNPNVRAIGLAGIRRLFPRCGVRTKKVTLAPPIARRLVPRSWILASLLEKIPALRTHHLHVIRKP